jgi:flavin-dependent dehydrogenase
MMSILSPQNSSPLPLATGSAPHAAAQPRPSATGAPPSRVVLLRARRVPRSPWEEAEQVGADLIAQHRVDGERVEGGWVGEGVRRPEVVEVINGGRDAVRPWG